MEQENTQFQKEQIEISREALLNKETRPLKEDECRTKLYGLQALEAICKRTGDIFLPYKVYEEPSDFSIKDFTDIDKGRLLIRTDPKRDDYTQTRNEWSIMPRLIIKLGHLLDKQLEREAQRQMEDLSRLRLLIPPLRFIVHKVRDLKDYDKTFQISRWQKSGGYISATNPNRLEDKEVFRAITDIDTFIRFQVTDGGKAVLDSLKGEFAPILLEKILRMVEEIAAYAQSTGHQWFEASSVTYNFAPFDPEYYDLRFLGKEGF